MENNYINEFTRIMWKEKKNSLQKKTKSLRQQAIDALNEGNIYSFIAENYWNLSKEELKEICINLSFAVYSSLGEETSKKIEKETAKELIEDRGFLDDEK